MVRPLLDTNIVIDFLNNAPPAVEEIARYEEATISAITWMEVMIGTTPANELATRALLSDLRPIPIDAAISEEAVRLRRLHRLKLPDAIIWATARVHGLLLVTRNTRDFAADDPGIRIPYSL